MCQCSALVSVQIEIAVVGQVADRIFVTNCVIGNGQSIGIVKGIGNSHLQISRIMFLAVRTLCGESNAVPAAFRLPDTPAQAAVTAVQMVFPIVAVQLYLLTVQDKPSVADTVAASSNSFAKIFSAGFIAFHMGIAQHHVPQLLLPIRHQQGNHRSTIITKCHACTGGILNAVEMCHLPTGSWFKF